MVTVDWKFSNKQVVTGDSNKADDTRYFGIIQAEINHDDKAIQLSLKRYSMPLLDGVVVSSIDWALSGLEAEYQGYDIQPVGIPDELWQVSNGNGDLSELC